MAPERRRFLVGPGRGEALNVKKANVTYRLLSRHGGVKTMAPKLSNGQPLRALLRRQVDAAETRLHTNSRRGNRVGTLCNRICKHQVKGAVQVGTLRQDPARVRENPELDSRRCSFEVG